MRLVALKYTTYIPSIHSRLFKNPRKPVLSCKCLLFDFFRANGNEHYNTFPPPKHWLDRAKVRHGGKFADRDVDDFKLFFRAFPVLMFLTVYCILYSQVGFPAGIYMFKANNRNTRTRCKICTKLTLKTPERRLKLTFLIKLL